VFFWGRIWGSSRDAFLWSGVTGDFFPINISKEVGIKNFHSDLRLGVTTYLF